MNVVYISPHFPLHYHRFCRQLKQAGANVLGIGDVPFDQLPPEVADSLTEYYRVADMHGIPHVYADFGTEKQKAIKAAHPDALEKLDFASGSMGPKVKGACWFVRETGNKSAIGQLSDLSSVVSGSAGTLISNEVEGIQFNE